MPKMHADWYAENACQEQNFHEILAFNDYPK